MLELAAALKREVPARTAAQVAAILRAHAGDVTTVPSARTLQRHFARWSFTPARTAGCPARSGGSRPKPQKFGVRGFAQSLRMELEHERLPIAVCTVLPSSINTPLFTLSTAAEN